MNVQGYLDNTLRAVVERALVRSRSLSRECSATEENLTMAEEIAAWLLTQRCNSFYSQEMGIYWPEKVALFVELAYNSALKGHSEDAWRNAAKAVATAYNALSSAENYLPRKKEDSSFSALTLAGLEAARQD